MKGKDHARVPRRLLTLKESADTLHYSVNTLRRRIVAGEIAVIRDGRLVRIDPEDLDRYIRNRRFG